MSVRIIGPSHFPLLLAVATLPVGVSVGRVRRRVERMDPALVGKEEEPSASEGKRQE